MEETTHQKLRTKNVKRQTSKEKEKIVEDCDKENIATQKNEKTSS